MREKEFFYKGIDGVMTPMSKVEEIKKKNTNKGYDWDKIREIIEENVQKGLVKAALGMREDWFWTGLDVWSKDKGGYIKTDCREYLNVADVEYDSERLIAGIDGSWWATPIIELTYEDGTTEIIEVYFTEEYEVDDHGKGI